jgi:Mg2+-importing ATPase
MLITVLIGFTGIADYLTMATMPLYYGIWLAALIAVYTVIVQILKPLYVKKYGSWI